MEEPATECLTPTTEMVLSLQELPFDCIVCICGFLTAKDLTRFSATCKVYTLSVTIVVLVTNAYTTIFLAVFSEVNCD